LLGPAHPFEDRDGLLAVGQELVFPELLGRVGRDDHVGEVLDVPVGDLVLQRHRVGQERVVLLLEVADQLDQRGDELNVRGGIGQVEHGLDLLQVQGLAGCRGGGGRGCGGRCNGLFHFRFSLPRLCGAGTARSRPDKRKEAERRNGSVQPLLFQGRSTS
jgi:hypothetical protein